MVYLKSVENVITSGKLIGLLFLFCLPLLSILFLKTKRNDLARPVMGTIFLVIYHMNKNLICYERTPESSLNPLLVRSYELFYLEDTLQRDTTHLCPQIY